MSIFEQNQDWKTSDLSKISFPFDQVNRTDFYDSKFGDKLFLGAGELQGENNQTYQFEVVKRAEERVNSQTWCEDYLPPEGDKEFVTLARDFLFGVKNLEGQIGKQLISFQTLGATGAIRLAFSFIKKHLDGKIYIPKLTWPLARTMAEDVGLNYEEFDLFDVSKQEIKSDQLMAIIKKAPKNSFLFLQDIANIPNGSDLSIDQWTDIFKIIKENQMCLIIDSAFQGYSSGDFETDSQVVRLLLQENLPFFIAQTFSKSLGLYGERIGCLHVNLFEDPGKIIRLLEEKVKLLWLSPNVHGARLVKTILQDPQLMKLWREEFQKIFSHIKENRELLKEALIKYGVKGNWQNLTKQNGIFLFLPLNKKHIGLLKEKYHIYNLDICRINLSSLRKIDIDRLAKAVKEVSDSSGL
jgi:aspartate/tyrosine/aromatic aminotransferase